MTISVDSIEEFVQVARAMGMVPQTDVITGAQAIAKKMLEDAGFTVENNVATPPAAQQQVQPDPAAKQDAADAAKLAAVNAATEPPKEKKQRGGKKDDKPAEPLKADQAQSGEDILGNAVDAKVLTKDDAIAALRNLAAKKSIEKCRELLVEFGAPKAGEVPEDKIAEFVAKANEMAGAA